MQLTADELRTAVGGQWIVAPPTAEPRRGIPAPPFMVQGVATDTRQSMKGALFVALRGDRFDAHAFLAQAQAAGAAAALVDRKAAAYERPAGLLLLEVGDTRIALRDLARYWRSRLRAKVVAITGSSGKTTTRRLVDAALATAMQGSASPKSFNNEVGVPLTVLGARASDGYLVAEIGMNHPGEIAPLARIAAPSVAIITMVGRAHLEGMGSLEAIVQEKSSLVDGLSTLGIAIVNGDQPQLVEAVRARLKPGVRLVTFGCGAECQWKLLERSPSGQVQTMRVAEPDGEAWNLQLGLGGEYNAMNALAALACARMLGIDRAGIAHAFAAIEAGEMRMMRQQVGGLAIYNDAYNANPDAMQASLRAFAELAAQAPRRVVVLGEMLELGAASQALHTEVALAAAATAPAPALAIFVGAQFEQGARLIERGGTQVLHLAQLDDNALARIAAVLVEGDAILLKGSRGSRMERLVQALSERAAGAGAAGAQGSVPCSTT